jgi:hypothetical protein
MTKAQILITIGIIHAEVVTRRELNGIFEKEAHAVAEGGRKAKFCEIACMGSNGCSVFCHDYNTIGCEDASKSI